MSQIFDLGPSFDFIRYPNVGAHCSGKVSMCDYWHIIRSFSTRFFPKI